MDYINHVHSVTVPRGGKVITGDNDYNGENVVIDTPEYDRLTLTPKFESTSKIGVIQPCLNFHVNSGDSFHISANMFQRFQPLVATPFTAFESTVHMFYCPFRLLDYGFEQFFTGGKDGDYKIPQLNARFYCPVVSDLAETVNDIGTETSVWSNTEIHDTKIFPSHVFNGKPLGGIGSLIEDFGYGFEVFRSVMDNDDVPIASRAPRSFSNLYPLIAYQRIYNDFYRVPELEPDLFLHNYRQSLSTYAQSLRTFSPEVNMHATDFATQDVTAMSLNSIVLEWLQSNYAEGFLGFMQHLLTDPLLHQQLVEECNKNSLWVNRTNSNLDLVAVNHSMVVQPSLSKIDLSRYLVFGQEDSNSVQQIYLALEWNEYIGEGEDGDDSVTHKLSDIDLCVFVYCLALTVCKNAPYERDRFNSMLPYLQRGEYIKLIKNNLVTGSPTTGVKTPTVVSDSIFENGLITSYKALTVGNNQYLASQISVDDLRQLNATAKFLEKNARVGYRFEEYIKGMFGIEVKGDDHLSKPSYIGGMKEYCNPEIVTSPVQTEYTLQAQQAANITLYSDGHVGDFSVPEPGIMLAFLITKPRTKYINAVDRNNYKFSDRTLFFTSDFAHLAEQPLWNTEVNGQYGAVNQFSLGELINGDLQSVISDISDAFCGYEPRYNEYRNIIDHIGGELCSTQIYNTTARQDIDYGNPDGTFHNDYYWQHVMYNDPSVTRIFNYADEVTDQFIFALGWSLERVSEVPNYANPKL